MSKHIDTLAEWWENAEEGVINEGDRLIYRDEDNYDFRIAKREDAGQAAEKEHEHGWAILDRAPAPKPAWHDAVAVIAGRGGERQVFTPTVSGMWESEDFILTPDEMTNPVPLIEQKVTDEMVDRLEHYFVATQQASLPVGFAEKMLNIALGLDPA